jgi:hypothetical protein
MCIHTYNNDNNNNVIKCKKLAFFVLSGNALSADILDNDPTRV